MQRWIGAFPRREVVEIFAISLTTLKRWMKMRREGKDLSPGVSTGRRRRILATPEEERLLWGQLEANDDATLQRHCELWEQKTGVARVRLFNEPGHTTEARLELQKKTLGATERDEQARAAFRERLRSVDGSRLIFVDESSTNVALTPRYGRAPKGERAFGKAPRNWGKNALR